MLKPQLVLERFSRSIELGLKVGDTFLNERQVALERNQPLFD